VEILSKSLFSFYFLLILSISGLAPKALGQEAAEQIEMEVLEIDTTAIVRKNTILAVPIGFFSPETSLGLGAAGLFAFRMPGESDSSIVSQVQLGFAYTLLNQILLYLPYRIIWGNQKNIAFGELGYYRYVYRFFGVGNNAHGIDEWYDANFPRIRLNYLREIIPKTYLGLTYYYDDLQIVGKDPSGELIKNEFIGSNGGKISGTGPIFIYDSRDKLFFPSKGYYVESAFWWFGNNIGSSFNFTKFYLDARKFITLLPDLILAINAFQEWNVGNVPFYELALLGGNKRMRGYFEGQLRDKAYSTFQSELRGKFTGRLGWAAFAAAGIVGESPSEYEWNNLRYTYGAGLRYMLDKKEKINVRLDVGLGKSTSGFYITVSEAF
jgi:hypothetical protein